MLKVPIKAVEPSPVAEKYIYCGTLENELKGKVPLSTGSWLDSSVAYNSIEYFRINKNWEKDMTVKICRSTMNFQSSYSQVEQLVVVTENSRW